MMVDLGTIKATSFRKRFAAILANWKINLILDIINAISTIISVIGYMISTYEEDLFYNYTWGSITFFFHFYFFTEYLMRLYSAKDFINVLE